MKIIVTALCVLFAASVFAANPQSIDPDAKQEKLATGLRQMNGLTKLTWTLDLDPAWDGPFTTLGDILLGGAGSVLAGLFALVERLYGISVELREDVDTWGPQVRYYALRDEQGAIALVLLAFVVWLIWLARKLVRGFFGRGNKLEPPPG